MQFISLFSDFWTSYRFDKGSNLSLSFQGSNNSLCSPQRNESLHKSKSEPINITSAKHFKKQRLGSSKSFQCFKEPISSHSEESLSETGSNPNLHDKSSPISFHLNRDGEVVSVPNIYPSSQEKLSRKGSLCEMCQSNLSNRDSDDNWSSGGSSGGAYRSRTHPRPVTKQKSNLYFTTSLDLFNIPDNQYFKSNLSDKMSDYEDVWRSSSCATPISSVTGKTKRHKCKRKCPYKKTDEKATVTSPNTTEKATVTSPNTTEKATVTSPTLLNNAISVLKSDNKIQTSIQNNLHTDASCQTNQSIRQLRKSVSLDIQNTQARLSESFRSDKVGTTISTQTSPVKVISKPKPLAKVDDKASSASGSTKSGVKSPVYAEPFDALDGDESEHVNLVRIRRRSAPSMGVTGKKLKGVLPQLETIVSPGHDNHESYNFDSSNEGAIDPDSINRNRPMRRSQSMKERSSQNGSDLSVLDKDSIRHVASELEKLKIAKNTNVDKQQRHFHKYQHDSIVEDCEERHEQEQITPTLRRFPVDKPSKRFNDSRHSMFSELSTVEDLISSVNPQLTVRPMPQVPDIIYSGAMSEYDNLTNHYAPPSVRSNAETEFCTPWDNTFYGNLLNGDPKAMPQMDIHSRILAWQKETFHLGRKEPGDRSSYNSDSTLVGDSDEDFIEHPELVLQPSSSGSSVENLTENAEHFPKFPLPIDLPSQIDHTTVKCVQESQQTNISHQQKGLYSLSLPFLYTLDLSISPYKI